jgi:hypothetical protein
VQLLLYGLGYYLMGLPVTRVVLAAYPRTAASLDGLYVWERAFTGADGRLMPEVGQLLEEVFIQTSIRRDTADDLIAGRIRIEDVAIAPDESECIFCPFFRPQTARDGGPGCAGPRKGLPV